MPVTLQDEDSSTQKLEGWKKINTLQHYRVFDGAEMALVRRYQSIKSPNGSLDTSVVSVTSSASMLRMESDSGTKFYHLVGTLSQSFFNLILLLSLSFTACLCLSLIHVIFSWAQIGRSAIFGREIGVPDREIFSRQKIFKFNVKNCLFASP